MAFRAANYWRTMLNRMGDRRAMTTFAGERRTMTTSTVPKMKPIAPAIDGEHIKPPRPYMSFKADMVPIYAVMGMVGLAVIFAVHTGKQQIMYSPSVHISKKKREMLPEVEEPDYVVEEADKFVNKSFFRKLAHIQDSDMAHTIREPGNNVFAHGREAETLKSVGVNPRSH